MLTPCEVAVKTVSPAIRALLAQTLFDKHNLNETQVAKILGVSQSAVSKYQKKVRGTTIPIEDLSEVQGIVIQMASILYTQPIQLPQQTQVMELFCKACIMIRSKGLMCTLCKQNQKPQVENCDFCNNPCLKIY